jgi:hypothetical protein
VISKWLGEDEDHAEVEEGEVVVGFAVAAGGDAPLRFQPGVGAFDRPAVTRLGVGGLEPPFLAAPDGAGGGAGGDRRAGGAWFADPRLDPAGDQCLLELA